jgi:DNA-binding LacI/PurR family transcriptional regulator
MSIVRVAQRAGVSVATVSRVINRLPGVRPETAKQVRRAMKELLYVPSAVRPGPKPGVRRPSRIRARVGTLVVLTIGQASRDWLALPLMTTAFAAITQAAQERGLRLLIDEMPDPHKVSNLLTRREVDGAIVFWSARLGRAHFEGLLDCGIPLVRFMGAVDGPAEIDHVTTDNLAVGRLAHGYLAEQGCSDVAFFTETPDWPLVRMRGQEFANAARDARHRVTSFVMTETPVVAANYGQGVCAAATAEALADCFAAESPRPTGIFCATDRQTLKLYPMLQRRGIMPGRDVTVVSCDNQEPLLSILTPRPASVDLRPGEIGRIAVTRLLHRLEYPDDPAFQVLVPPVIGLVNGTDDAASDSGGAAFGSIPHGPARAQPVIRAVGDSDTSNPGRRRK